MVFRHEQGFLSVDSMKFQYFREGHGPPLLVIGSATYYSRAFSHNLRDHFELICVDLRHFIGAYTPSEEELAKVTLETFADDVESIRESLGIERLALVGHSSNAHIAITYATKHPQHTSHLILVCGVPYAFSEFSEEAEDFWKKNASDERKAILAENLERLDTVRASGPPTRSFAAMFLANGSKVWRDPSYDAAWLVKGVESNAALHHLMALLPRRADARRSLEKVDMPTLVMSGRHDYAIPYPLWDELVSGLDNLTYHVLAESSHSPQTEDPDVFDELLISWFSRGSDAGGRQ